MKKFYSSFRYIKQKQKISIITQKKVSYMIKAKNTVALVCGGVLLLVFASAFVLVR